MNLKLLSYEKKYKLVLILFGLLLLVIYEFSIKNTINYMVLDQEQNSAELGPTISEFDWGVLRQKKKLMNRVLTNFLRPESIKGNDLLETVSTYCAENNVKLKEVSAPIISTDSIFSVSTTRVILLGEYKNLVQLSDAIEKNHELGKVSSVHYQSFIDNKNGSLKLECIIYIQNLLDLK